MLEARPCEASRCTDPVTVTMVVTAALANAAADVLAAAAPAAAAPTYRFTLWGKPLVPADAAGADLAVPEDVVDVYDDFLSGAELAELQAQARVRLAAPGAEEPSAVSLALDVNVILTDRPLYFISVVILHTKYIGRYRDVA